MTRGPMGSPRKPRAGSGFTLVELLVAMVLLQIGLLASAGLVVLAARSLARAAELERAVTLVEGMADSLTSGPWHGAGERRVPPFQVRWSEVRDGFRVEALPLDVDTALVTVTVPWRPGAPTEGPSGAE